MPNQSAYIGRFAPSPSGSLHFGSLIAALGSYLQARHQCGQWLVRIEDIDPPREVAGAADDILRTLEAHHLHWDQSVFWQSQCYQRYEQTLSKLSEQQLTYACHCTRAQIKQRGALYDGHCRELALSSKGNAIRFRQDHSVVEFYDILQGKVCNQQPTQDVVLKRKDGLYAYNLAMVSDDIAQGVTEVVRGADLLQPTFGQIALYRALEQPEPVYFHLPVAVSKPGFKLSKQNHASPIDSRKAATNLFEALHFLGQQPPKDMQHCSVEEVLDWGIAHWNMAHLPQSREIQVFPSQ